MASRKLLRLYCPNSNSAEICLSFSVLSRRCSATQFKLFKFHPRWCLLVLHYLISQNWGELSQPPSLVLCATHQCGCYITWSCESWSHESLSARWRVDLVRVDLSGGSCSRENWSHGTESWGNQWLHPVTAFFNLLVLQFSFQWTTQGIFVISVLTW